MNAKYIMETPDETSRITFWRYQGGIW